MSWRGRAAENFTPPGRPPLGLNSNGPFEGRGNFQARKSLEEEEATNLQTHAFFMASFSFCPGSSPRALN